MVVCCFGGRVTLKSGRRWGLHQPESRNGQFAPRQERMFREETVDGLYQGVMVGFIWLLWARRLKEKGEACDFVNF